MVDRLKWINEIMHRFVTKIYWERTKSHEWLDTDFEEMVGHWVSQNLQIEDTVNTAINNSYKSDTEGYRIEFESYTDAPEETKFSEREG